MLALTIAAFAVACGGDETTPVESERGTEDTGSTRPRFDASGEEDDTTVAVDTDDCESGDRLCSADGRAVLICLGDGETTAVDCRADEVCVAAECVLAEDADAGVPDVEDDAEQDTGCVGDACETVCTAGTSTCDGDNVVTCNGDGTGTTITDRCATGTCAGGECQSGCGDGKTYVGCEFWGADLDHWEPGDRQQYAISVSNPSATGVAVTVRDGAGIEVAGASVAAGGLQTFPLPRQDVSHSSLSSNSYQVSATGPVTAHQFNPLNQSGVASNDASLLLPTPALGREYYVLGWPTVSSGRVADGRAYTTIIATQDATTVTVVASADVDANEGVEALAAGMTRAWELDRGEVLSLGTNRTHGRDLTGTRIISTAPVAVFFGHECADIPLGTCCCDHIEQQMVPVEAWGRSVLAAKFESRGSESDLWRIIAAEDGTAVTLTPAPTESGPASFTLNAGQFQEVRSAAAFAVEASAPIMVGQFMTGSSAPGVGRRGCSGFLSGNSGDPAYTLNVPTEQWLSSYVVLTPEGFDANHLTIVTQGAANVTLDGAPISSSAIAVGTTGYSLYRPAVNAGVHRVTSDQPVGLYAYGFDCAVSYAYPGGLNLAE
jgi:hypothetical protein